MDLQSLLAALAERVTTDPLTDVLIVLVIIALLRVVFLSVRIARLTRGADGKSLESAIQMLVSKVEMLSTHAEKTETALNNLDTRMQGAVRGVSVRRYDPFENAGGQQSFTSALLSEEGNGVVLSGIHTRDSVRVYAKEVKNFASERELSADEAAAIKDAQKKLGAS